MTTKGTTDHMVNVLNYYEECWLTRFKSGHNPKSLAMHMGYFDDIAIDNDDAKNNMNQFLAKNLNLDASLLGQVIIDAGCGIGGTCLFLAQNYEGLNITGINISSQQIAMANEFILNRPEIKSKINFLCEDYCHTSLVSDTADSIYTIESLCHAADKEQFYEEAFRILKPGGTLLIIDYIDTQKNPGPDTPDVRRSFQKGWVVKEYISNPKEDLTKAGFINIDIKSIKSKVMPGIIKSHNGAIDKIKSLNGNISPIVKGHLEACIALKNLSENDVIDYCVIKSKKPF